LRDNINNNRGNRQNHELQVEQARCSLFSRFGPSCFGPMVRWEPYLPGFKGPRNIEKYDLNGGCHQKCTDK
jgi:hypothetical protein